jgi:hypothetical protein
MRNRGGGLGWPEAESDDADGMLGWPDVNGEVEGTGDTDDAR